MKKKIIILIWVIGCFKSYASNPRKTYSVGELIHVFDPTIPDSKYGATLVAKDLEEEEEDFIKKLKKQQYKRSLLEKEIQDTVASYKTDVQGFTRGKVFKANAYNGGTPSDNTLAISNSGFFVSSINSTVDFYDSTGKLLITKSLSSFAKDASLTFTFDPKVLYDPEADRFILVFLAGNTPTTSKVVVAFSTSDDPRKTWNVYKLSGDPLKDNSWTDYPNIGVSKADVYISTNLFSSNNTFSQAVVEQIPKADGYSGASTLKILIWDNLLDNNSDQMLGLYPLMGGQSKLYGPGMYLASTMRGQGDNFCITHITGDYSDPNNTITMNNVSCNTYQVGREAAMKSNSDDLSVGDCRVKGGFQLADNLYFVFSGTFGLNIWSSIVYVKFNVKSNSFKMATLGKQFESFCYPNIASFATDEYDETVAICFNASSSKYYPEARSVVCDSWMQFSAIDTFKRGDTYIEVLGAGVAERWGDYSGITRWHSKPYRSVWAHNMVGQIQTNGTRTIGNWISEMTSKTPSFQGIDNIDLVNTEVYPNPVVNEIINVVFKFNGSKNVSVKLMNIEGREVSQMVEQKLNPGNYEFRMNTAGLASGVYFINIYSNSNLIKTKQVIIP
ncbi:MAG: T9SS type A sorting domain-containing protein [Bacteroidetes bacterium]|nr:T9SS type A sorting domain-containing protein [Bacteroidota bacterium]